MINEPNPYAAPAATPSFSTAQIPTRSRFETPWHWSIWLVSLAASSVAILGLGFAYDARHTGYMLKGEHYRANWAYRSIELVFLFHLTISAAAFIATFRLTNRWNWRNLGWLVIAIFLVWTAMASVGAGMSISGVYL